MKSPRFILLTLLLTLGIPATPWAETPAPADPFVKDKSAAAAQPVAKDKAAPANYVFIFEWYVVNKNDYAGLLDMLPDEKARYARVNEWVKQGKAKLEDVTAGSAKSGQRFIIESIDELRYATQFDPPTRSGFIPPLHYETRNVGNTEEVEFIAQDTGADISGSLQRVHFDGMKECRGNSEAPESAALQPGFTNRKFHTNIWVNYNEPTLLSTLVDSAGSKGSNEGDGLRLCYVNIQNQPLPHIEKAESPSSHRVLRFDYSFYSMERSLARSLLLQDKDGKTLHGEVTALLSAQNATLESTTTLKTKSGVRTVSEAITEFRYGVSTKTTHPEEVSRKVNTPAPAGSNVPDIKTPPASKEISFYTAYETRNIGHTIELEPVLSPDETIVDLVHAPQFINLIAQPKPDGLAAKYPEQPLFQVSKITAHLSAAVDQQTFIGTFNKPGDTGTPGSKDDGRVWMGFVKVSFE